MVTKAELEKQVAELRRQLDEREKAETSTGSAAKSAKQKLQEAVEDIPDRLSSEWEDWSREIDEALAELDTLPHKKAILFSLGVFALGYLIGRAR